MAIISFNNNGVSPRLQCKEELKKFLVSVFQTEGVDLKRVSYVFCKDNYMLGLNKEFLNHNTYTDIITFTLSDKGNALASEIYISVERVKENATKLKREYYEELLRVMIHGILHLCEYSDHTVNEKQEMRQKEDFYLSKWFHVKRST